MKVLNRIKWVICFPLILCMLTGCNSNKGNENIVKFVHAYCNGYYKEAYLAQEKNLYAVCDSKLKNKLSQYPDDILSVSESSNKDNRDTTRYEFACTGATDTTGYALVLVHPSMGKDYFQLFNFHLNSNKLIDNYTITKSYSTK